MEARFGKIAARLTRRAFVFDNKKVYQVISGKSARRVNGRKK
jgi:hypothetical protein